ELWDGVDAHMQRRQMPPFSPNSRLAWLLLQPGHCVVSGKRGIRDGSACRKPMPATPSPKTHSQEELWR
ncbi:MAG: hypothetical protein E6559_17610, partial [Pantoea sp.]|nr:hypothetical protein [Pantoea sp.]